MGDLDLMPASPQNLSYALYRPSCMMSPFKLLLAMSHCTERAMRATGRKNFLSHWAREWYFHLHVLISLYSSWFPFHFCTLWGQLFHQPPWRYRSNFIWEIADPSCEHLERAKVPLQIWNLRSSGKKPKKALNLCRSPDLFFSVAAQACRVGFSPANRDDGSEIPLSEQLL